MLGFTFSTVAHCHFDGREMTFDCGGGVGDLDDGLDVEWSHQGFVSRNASSEPTSFLNEFRFALCSALVNRCFWSRNVLEFCWIFFKSCSCEIEL